MKFPKTSQNNFYLSCEIHKVRLRTFWQNIDESVSLQESYNLL